VGAFIHKRFIRRWRLFLTILSGIIVIFASLALFSQIRQYQTIKRYEEQIQYFQHITPLLRSLQDERDASLWSLDFPETKSPKLLLRRVRVKTDDNFDKVNLFLWRHPHWKERHEIRAFLSAYSHLASTRLSLDEYAIDQRELSLAYENLVDTLIHTATGMLESAPLPEMEISADNFRELLWLMDIRSMERSLILRLQPTGESYNRFIEDLRSLHGRLQEHLNRYWLHRTGKINLHTLPLLHPTLEKKYESMRIEIARMMAISDLMRQKWWELSQQYLQELESLSHKLLYDLQRKNNQVLYQQNVILLGLFILMVSALMLIAWGYRYGVRYLQSTLKLISSKKPPHIEGKKTFSISSEEKKNSLDTSRDKTVISQSEFFELLFRFYRQARHKDELYALLYLSFSPTKKLTSKNVAELAIDRLRTLNAPPYYISLLEEEFLGILLTGLDENRSSAVKEISLIIEQIESVLQSTTRESTGMRPSIGVKIFPNTETRWESVLTHAAKALERSKSVTSEAFCLYDDYMDLESKRFLRLKDEFAQALQKKELILHYQPRVSLSTNRIVGMEALIRWKHPHRGMIHPKEFLYLSKGTYLAWELDQYVLKEVCTQIERWKEQFKQFDLKISINLSGHSLIHPDALAWSLEYLTSRKMLARQLEFEISQETLFRDLEQTTGAMEQFKELGVRFCLDNFGTGYSSIDYLKRLPVDIAKIDRGFILDLPDRHNEEVVKLMIKTAEVFGLETVAEGVERQQTLEFLREVGCTYYQGFHCTAPLSPQEMEEFLQHQSRCDAGKEHYSKTFSS